MIGLLFAYIYVTSVLPERLIILPVFKRHLSWVQHISLNIYGSILVGLQNDFNITLVITRI